MTAAYALGMVPSVFAEVTHPGRSGSDEFRRYAQNDRLSVVRFEHTGELSPPLSAMGGGERDTILAGSAGRTVFIILDDRKGARYCRAHAIPYTNALLCAKALNLSGVIEFDRYIGVFNKILSSGRYARPIVEFAEKATVETIRLFLP